MKLPLACFEAQDLGGQHGQTFFFGFRSNHISTGQPVHKRVNKHKVCVLVKPVIFSIFNNIVGKIMSILSRSKLIWSFLRNFYSLMCIICKFLSSFRFTHFYSKRATKTGWNLILINFFSRNWVEFSWQEVCAIGVSVDQRWCRRLGNS